VRSTVSAVTEPAFTITPLAVEDCDELGRVHMAIWRDTYRSLMPAEYLAGLDEDESAQRWRKRAASRGPATTLVARDASGAVVGFVSSGPSRDEDAPTEWQLYAVNLVVAAQGTGLADVLLDRALGDRDAMLWVAEGNARAVAFYRRRGFVEDGGRSVHDGSGAAEVRMVRRGGLRHTSPA
jgi:ribosomal protein S18 acetylase RimI-like enzyme